MKKILSFRESISKARWKSISVSTRKSICTKTTKDTRNSEEFTVQKVLRRSTKSFTVFRVSSNCFRATNQDSGPTILLPSLKSDIFFANVLSVLRASNAATIRTKICPWRISNFNVLKLFSVVERLEGETISDIRFLRESILANQNRERAKG